MVADHGAPTPSAGTLCVLWTAPPPRTPAPLADLLAQRGFTVEIATGAHLAMARACRAVAEDRRVIVILDRPGRLQRTEELTRALQAHAPDVLIWSYDPAQRPNLAALTTEPAPNSGGPSQVSNGRRPAPLRLVGDGPAEAGPDNRDAEPPATHAVLSPEELEMLLAEEDR